jgi:cysteine desulfurase
MAERIYLDHAATTPLRAEVRAAMDPFISDDYFGNPSSLHFDGQRARRAVDAARETVASALGVKFAEITFTSGGTEADNAAVVGVMLAGRHRGPAPDSGSAAQSRGHLVTTQIEHEAVLRSSAFLESLDFRVTYVAPDVAGLVTPEDIAAVAERTVLVSVMHANNEVGTIQPVAEIARIAKQHGAFLHTDAVQSFGRLPVTADDLGADLISISAHKIYGPKGVGALYVREGVPIEPLLHGGSQERERRAGTENVAGIVGFAAATALAMAEREDEARRMGLLRDGLIHRLLQAVPGAVLNGHRTKRLPNNVNVSFPPLEAEAILLSLDLAGISASSGSACSSGSIEPSHVLTAMGLPIDAVRSAIRFTLGRSTTGEQIDHAGTVIVETVRRLLRRMQK